MAVYQGVMLNFFQHPTGQATCLVYNMQGADLARGVPK